MITLGLNAFHADAAAALLVDGRLAVAIEEERLTRVKHCAGFPARAARACLEIAGVRPSQIDHVAVSRDPSANLLAKLLHLAGPGRGMAAQALRSRLENAGRIRGIEAPLRAALLPLEPTAPDRLRARFHAVEHHAAHLASAFLCSPFDEAAVLSVDGFGDFVSTTWAHARGREIAPLGRVRYPDSLGVLYTATSQYLGFDRYGDEGKVMGLAPFGRPRFTDSLGRACRETGDAFALDADWFTHVRGGVEMAWDDGTPLIGRLWSERFVTELGPARAPGEPLDERHHDVAASLQAVTEARLFHLLRRLHARTGSPRLCLAGGVALNSVANGKIVERTPFEEVYVQPAAGDAGTALGAALHVEHARLGRPRSLVFSHPATGPSFDERAVAAAIDRARPRLAGVHVEELRDEGARVTRAARAIAAGRLVGWFDGRMEFGPRALGQRSVLADPRRAELKDALNLRIKRREPFRPFAPAILEERVGEWFVGGRPSPAMLLVLPFREDKRALVPAVAHVDGSGRLQTVARDRQPAFHALLGAFERETGVPILLNTSFNENEPIVCTPDEALDCFARTGLDALAIGPFLLERAPLPRTPEAAPHA